MIMCKINFLLKFHPKYFVRPQTKIFGKLLFRYAIDTFNICNI